MIRGERARGEGARTNKVHYRFVSLTVTHTKTVLTHISAFVKELRCRCVVAVDFKVSGIVTENFVSKTSILQRTSRRHNVARLRSFWLELVRVTLPPLLSRILRYSSSRIARTSTHATDFCPVKLKQHGHLQVKEHWYHCALTIGLVVIF